MIIKNGHPFVVGIVLNTIQHQTHGSQVTKEKLRHREIKCLVLGHTARMRAQISLTLKPVHLISNIREKGMVFQGEGRSNRGLGGGREGS